MVKNTSDAINFILNEAIPSDFGVETVFIKTNAALYVALKRDVYHFVSAEVTVQEGGFHSTNIKQKSIPRYLVADVFKNLDEFIKISGYSSEDELLSTSGSEETGIYALGKNRYYIDLIESEFSLPKKIRGTITGDVATLEVARGKVKFKDEVYYLPRSKTFHKNAVSAKSKKLVEAVAFERETHGGLNARKFGIYSAFCSWKDFHERTGKDISFFEQLIDSQFIYDANSGNYGEFMGVAQEVQDTMLTKRIWGEGILIDREEAIKVLAEGMSKLSSIQLTQFSLMNGMHEAGLFLPLAVILGIITWETYIDWTAMAICNGASVDGLIADPFYRGICSDAAIIKMLGDF